MRNAIALVLALAACGGATPAPTTPPLAPVAEAPKPTAAPTLLTLGELRMLAGTDEGVRIHGDGSVELKQDDASWKTVASVHPDGTVTSDGRPIGQLQADGTFKMADGSQSPFKLDGLTLVARDKRLSFDGQGALQGGPETGIHVTGLSDDGSRRTALLVIGLSLVTGN